ATMRIGATAIPVNPIYTPDEISYIIQNSDAKAVIALDQLLPLVEQAASAFPTVVHYIICETEASTPEKIAALPASVKNKVRSFTQLIGAGITTVNPVDVDENETAIILYTSGTTGRPKGAMLTHKNIYSNARDVGDYLGFSEDDRVVATLP
ncbi:AMP-binding protein, partial [Microvirga sp. 3-52]|nr:AMP-binding protein [Microvirga sp. 3-52]